MQCTVHPQLNTSIPFSKYCIRITQFYREQAMCGVQSWRNHLLTWWFWGADEATVWLSCSGVNLMPNCLLLLCSGWLKDKWIDRQTDRPCEFCFSNGKVSVSTSVPNPMCGWCYCYSHANKCTHIHTISCALWWMGVMCAEAKSSTFAVSFLKPWKCTRRQPNCQETSER